MNENLAINEADMNLAISPLENFYQFSNGGWIKNNPVPSDKTQYGSFTVIYDNNQKQLKDLVLEVSKQKNEKGTNAQKIADFYNSGMDTIKIETEKYEPIKNDLAEIDNIKTKDDFIAQIAKMHSTGYSPLFYISDIQDDRIWCPI